jgi:hypothetical protein
MFNYPIHRRKSRRLNGYDYAKEGLYFITICTKNKNRFFGNIEFGVLNKTIDAIIAFDIWKQIPIQFPFVELDEFVVMPDHIHGIVIINQPNESVGARLIAPLRGSKQKTGGFTGDQNPMLHQNLSRIIRWYKGRSTFEIRKLNSCFEWQRNYHDHIILDNESYELISQ